MAMIKRQRVQRLMRSMGLAGMAPGSNMSKAHPEHKVYPYLLRGRTRGAAESGVGHGRNVYAHAHGVTLGAGRAKFLAGTGRARNGRPLLFRDRRGYATESPSTQILHRPCMQAKYKPEMTKGYKPKLVTL
jgi:hypothetical protein